MVTACGNSNFVYAHADWNDVNNIDGGSNIELDGR